MSVALRFSLLRNSLGISCPVRFFKQHAGISSAKWLDPRIFERRHFTTGVQTLETKFTGAPSWPKADSSSCVPGIQSLFLQQTTEHEQPGTVLVFDIETTGFLHKDHRIIEFALRDLSGGKNCTFETLINPERDVPRFATAITRIDTDLVCRPEIPRFKDVLPVLLAYVRSRQAPGKPVLWVAHNAKNFDVPFLVHEFRLCSADIPSDWFFIDSLSLARKLVNSEVKSSGEKRRLINLEALREHYGILSEGTAHRAMRDVTILCQVIQKITFDLKLTYEGLWNESIRATDCRKLSY
ncbi:hypothetical protein EJB05_38343 [Eragrostis curvula]|uniref:Exonuclease domain-containing protein n=1 Tax=Eragrostis curvula TaxID=38414 RepID=A0A5J9TUJ4_9POAL|nr:hypothetical protein EJB05_38343 [Eragrostis curvula]